MAKKFKTNALRMLDKAKIAYLIKEYEYDEDHLDGKTCSKSGRYGARSYF